MEESTVADEEHGGGQLDALDADAEGKSIVADAGNNIVLTLELHRAGNLDITAQELGVVAVGPHMHLAVINNFVI